MRTELSSVWIVHHVHRFPDGGEDVKLIGAFSCRDSATKAIELIKRQPGFRDVPDGFEIDRYEVDQFEWREGYMIVEAKE